MTRQATDRLKAFGADERGSIAAWFGILLVPMLGFTFGAIKFSELAGHRSGMIDAMDAAGLGLARQMDEARRQVGVDLPFDQADPPV